MANEQNLQPKPPWKKGESGNPKGRPPKTINAIMRELGEGTLLDCKYRFEHKGEIIERSISFESIDNKRKYKAAINEVVASQVIKQAIAGDIQSQKLLIESQSTDSADNTPQQITIIREIQNGSEGQIFEGSGEDILGSTE